MSQETGPSNVIRLGISTCPNDTFTFHALLNGLVDWRGLDFQVELLDIQELNHRLFDDRFDVAKTSFHAALLLADKTLVLPSGSALGYGVGPLVLASQPNSIPKESTQRVLCPGEHTTATLLFKLFHPNSATIQHCVFSEIMPRLQSDVADFGVCIHEGRFTWQEQGLHLVGDLGARWEDSTQTPLPLGGLVASRSLSRETIERVQDVIHDSLQYSLKHPEQALPTMRAHAQEFGDDVLMKHVDLYVNDWTVDLGSVGRDALGKLSEMARSIGLIQAGMPKIQVWAKNQ